MADENEVVTGAESATEGSEQPTQPDIEVEADGGESSGDKENRIPISRAEEMWRRREAKLRQELLDKEVNPLKKKFEDLNGKQTEALIGWLKGMGYYQEQPEKPLSRKELEEMFDQREKNLTRQMLAHSYEERIRSGWVTVAGKYPGLAKNKLFQSAVLDSYANDPSTSVADHAEAVVKNLLDPYHTEKSASLQREREDQTRPDRRVVPSGRGAGGSGTGKNEKKMSVAERIQARLKERE